MRTVLTTILLLSAAPALAAAGPDTVSAASLKLARQGDAALAAKQPAAAIDAYETALAVDPKNAAAYVGIARAYQAQGLPGKAVKYYRDALMLEPNDLGALEGQGMMLVQRGATARANLNLQRIKTLCKADCSAATRLETAMAAPAVPAPKTASAEPVKAAGAAKN